jgi:prepilin peptidase CpaA
LTFGSAAAALVFLALSEGQSGVLRCAAGWGLGLAVFLPFFLLRGMGAGDVKLLAALGAWVGPGVVVWVALYGAVAGAVFAVALSLAHGYLRPALGNIGHMFGYWMAFGPKPVPELTLSEAKAPRLPYALPITLGLVAALWFR